MVQIIRDIEQGTPEWHALRLGRMTASHAQAIATGGKGLETLCRTLAAQIYAGMTNPDGFKSDAMQRGNDEEHIAREAYTLTTGREVEQVAFGIWNDYVGASPDGLVGDEGGIEIKRKSFDKHANLLLGAEDFETSYQWQVAMNLLIFDRAWWDLMSWNPCFGAKSLYIRHIERDPLKDEQLLAGFDKGEKLIKQYLEILNK